ncbi:MAG TPA: hypothetical protein VG144_10700 [Gaiellaceae bacterium]|jgi:hypothetical protein|nr:hypothetical protein [Gaiellaceae bacterium]
MRYWRRRHEPFDLEAELRASRPEPRSELVHQLEARVRTSGRTRAGSFRVAFVGALTAVMLLALAAVGGVGYASSAGRDAVVSVKRIVTPGDVVKVLKRSSAQQQYGPSKPAKKAKKRAVKKAKKGKGAKGRVRARTRPPFTG